MNTSDFEMMGWPLVRVEGDAMPRVSHIVLAERFEMARPQVARNLIERNRAEFERYGALPMRLSVSTIEKRGAIVGVEEREVEEILLNEGQSLLFGTLARTPKAADVREGLIRLFMFFREIVSTAIRAELESVHGAIRRLELAVDDTRLCAVRASNQTAALAIQLQDSVGEGGTISANRFNKLWDDLRTLADVEVRIGKWATRRAALADIQREMRDSVEWGGKGQPWNEMKATDETAVRAVLRRRMKDATRRPKGGGGNGKSREQRTVQGQQRIDFSRLSEPN